jgi:D-alanyl-D-alanine-carboxypeptidase/D-alanyl-D-alanine-endopeptidase
LGDALASATRESYAKLVHDRLIEPLGMWDTTLSPSPEQCVRLLRDAFDEGPCTDTQASGPSGGLYTTPNDMVKFLRYMLHIPGLPEAPASLLSIYVKPKQLKTMQGLDHAGRPTGIGLAWIQLGDPNGVSMVMQKTGGGAGFSTYIALNPQKQAGIFAAITYGKGPENVNFFEESNKVLAALAGVPAVPAKVHLRRATSRRGKRRRAAARKN